MSWYSPGTITAAAGALVTMLDTYLPLNSHWALYDTVSTNVHVYGHLNDSSAYDFFFYVADNQADYATIQFGDNWNATTHTWTGSNYLTVHYGGSYTFRIRKPGVQTFYLKVTNNAFIPIFLSSGFGYYCGHPKRYNTGKVQPMFFGHTSYANASSGYNINPLCGLAYNIGTSSCNITDYLLDTAGALATTKFVAVGFTIPYLGMQSGSTYAKLDLYTTAGTFVLFESPVGDYATPYTIFGLMDGVCCTAGNSLGMVNGDTVTVDGVDWLVLVGAGGGTCFIQEN